MKIKHQRRLFLEVALFLLIIILGVIAFNSFDSRSVTGNAIKVIPLSSEESQHVKSILLSSEFIGDVPKKNPIALRFYSFENGQRVWRDQFLISEGELLNESAPTLTLILDSKYISQFNEDNLCEVANLAKLNGDLGYFSESGEAMLLIKYAGMLKHRECFGF